jgi:hypothetical protein
MAVKVSEAHGEFAAFDSSSLVMAFGATAEEARENLERENREQLDYLRALGPHRLSGHLAAVLALLERRYGGVG